MLMIFFTLKNDITFWGSTDNFRSTRYVVSNLLKGKLLVVGHCRYNFAIDTDYKAKELAWTGHKN